MPSSPNYKRDYVQERLNESPKRKKQRLLRDKARRQLMKEGKVKKYDGKDVDHKKPLSKGGANERSNLRVRDASANRSYERNSKGGMK
jgi:5-methylcytosine-specific restriction endonuclease McrA